MMTTTLTTYAAALHTLIDLAKDGGSTAIRVRSLLLSLLVDDGETVQLGSLLCNADRQNHDAILSVLSGWKAYRWRQVPGVPDADDFIQDMLARAA